MILTPISAQQLRGQYMTTVHRQAVEAALHLQRTASNIAGLLDADMAPEAPILNSVETWLEVLEGQLHVLRGEVKGLRHEYRLRRQGQL